MSVLEGLLYGLLQGLTEFLPVSSSGHLALAQNIFGAKDMESNYLTFTVLLHLGTLAAVVFVYRKDVWLMIKGFFTLMKKLFTSRLREGLDYGEKLFLLVFIATVPLVAAVFLEDKIESVSGVVWAIGLLLIINGLMLFVADRLAKGNLTVQDARPRHAIFVGIMQVLGIFPGISRSGATVTGGLFAGFNKEDAVKISFLMSIPAIAGANILKIFELKNNPQPEGSLPAVLCGIAAAVISGFAAIKLLQFIAKSKKLSVFSLYCVIVGAAAIIYDIIN